MSFEEENERFFPKHQLGLEVGLAEYELASKKLNGEDKAFHWATGTLTLVAPLVGLLGFQIGGLDRFYALSIGMQLLGLAFAITFSLMAVAHIAKLLREKTYAERKIVVVRRMLGASYGKQTLVLPNWRIEGADEPFSLRIWPGTISYSAIPAYIIISFSAIAVFFGSAKVFEDFPFPLLGIENAGTHLQIFATTGWSICLFIFFRLLLDEINENIRQKYARLLALLLKIELVPNFEFAIYRMRLEVAEAKRLKSDFIEIRKMAVKIEDQRFFSHSGISWHGIARAIKQFWKSGKKSGGSTVTQQLARTVFITNLRPAIRRKLVEMALAKWLESIFEKSEILDLYLCNARFDLGVYGFHRAFHQFFLAQANAISKAEAFVLVERLANIQGQLLGNRVHQLLKQQIETKNLSGAQALEVLQIYSNMIQTRISESRTQMSLTQIAESLNLGSEFGEFAARNAPQNSALEELK